MQRGGPEYSAEARTQRGKARTQRGRTRRQRDGQNAARKPECSGQNAGARGSGGGAREPKERQEAARRPECSAEGQNAARRGDGPGSRQEAAPRGRQQICPDISSERRAPEQGPGRRAQRAPGLAKGARSDARDVGGVTSFNAEGNNLSETRVTPERVVAWLARSAGRVCQRDPTRLNCHKSVSRHRGTQNECPRCSVGHGFGS